MADTKKTNNEPQDSSSSSSLQQRNKIVPIPSNKDSINRAQAARLRGNANTSRRTSLKKSNRHLASGPDASRGPTNRGAIRRSSSTRPKQPPPSAPPPSTDGSSTSNATAPPPPRRTSTSSAPVAAELSKLQEKQLVKMFNKHFSKIVSDIAREKAAAERALAEFNRQKAVLEAQHREYKSNPSSCSSSPTPLVGIERKLYDLHKRNESIKKKETDTKKLYNRYISKYAKSHYHTKAQEANLKEKVEHLAKKEEVERSAPATERVTVQPDKDRREVETMRGSEVKIVKEKTETLRERVASGGADAKRVILPVAVSSHLFVDGNGKQTPATPVTPASASLSDNKELMERAQARALDAEIAGMKEEASLHHRQQQTTRVNSWTCLNSDDEDEDDETQPTTADDEVSCLSYDDRQLEEILKKDWAKFEFEVDDGDSGSNSHATEEREAILAFERAAKAMEDELASFASSYHEDEDCDWLLDNDDASQKSGESWYAYWSEEHQREYYYEANTKRTSWEKPARVLERRGSFSDDGSRVGSGGGRSVSSKNSRRLSSSKMTGLPTVSEKSSSADVASTPQKSNRSVVAIHDDDDVTNSSVGTSVVTHEWSADDFMEDHRLHHSRRSSHALRMDLARRKQKRRNRRKRRIRRAIYVIVMSSACVAVGVYYKEEVRGLLGWHGPEEVVLVQEEEEMEGEGEVLPPIEMLEIPPMTTVEDGRFLRGDNDDKDDNSDDVNNSLLNKSQKSEGDGDNDTIESNDAPPEDKPVHDTIVNEMIDSNDDAEVETLDDVTTEEQQVTEEINKDDDNVLDDENDVIKDDDGPEVESDVIDKTTETTIVADDEADDDKLSVTESLDGSSSEISFKTAKEEDSIDIASRDSWDEETNDVVELENEATEDDEDDVSEEFDSVDIDDMTIDVATEETDDEMTVVNEAQLTEVGDSDEQSIDDAVQDNDDDEEPDVQDDADNNDKNQPVELKEEILLEDGNSDEQFIDDAVEEINNEEPNVQDDVDSNDKAQPIELTEEINVEIDDNEVEILDEVIDETNVKTDDSEHDISDYIEDDSSTTLLPSEKNDTTEENNDIEEEARREIIDSVDSDGESIETPEENISIGHEREESDELSTTDQLLDEILQSPLETPGEDPIDNDLNVNVEVENVEVDVIDDDLEKDEDENNDELYLDAVTPEEDNASDSHPEQPDSDTTEEQQLHENTVKMDSTTSPQSDNDSQDLDQKQQQIVESSKPAAPLNNGSLFNSTPFMPRRKHTTNDAENDVITDMTHNSNDNNNINDDVENNTDNNKYITRLDAILNKLQSEAPMELHHSLDDVVRILGDVVTNTAVDDTDKEGDGVMSTLLIDGNIVDSIASIEPTVTSLVPATTETDAATEEDNTNSVTKPIERRPIRCFMPLFMRLFPRCRRLARERPLYDLKALADSMMQ